MQPEHPLIEAAKEHFGTTYNPEEAGYITPMGTMIKVGRKTDAFGTSYVHHGDVARLSEEPLDLEGSNPLTPHDFMRRTGAARWGYIPYKLTDQNTEGEPASLVEHAHPLTERQKSMILRLSGKGELSVNAVHPDTGAIHYDANAGGFDRLSRKAEMLDDSNNALRDVDRDYSNWREDDYDPELSKGLSQMTPQVMRDKDGNLIIPAALLQSTDPNLQDGVNESDGSGDIPPAEGGEDDMGGDPNAGVAPDGSMPPGAEGGMPPDAMGAGGPDDGGGEMPPGAEGEMPDGLNTPPMGEDDNDEEAPADAASEDGDMGEEDESDHDPYANRVKLAQELAAMAALGKSGAAAPTRKSTMSEQQEQVIYGGVDELINMIRPAIQKAVSEEIGKALSPYLGESGTLTKSLNTIAEGVGQALKDNETLAKAIHGQSEVLAKGVVPAPKTNDAAAKVTPEARNPVSQSDVLQKAAVTTAPNLEGGAADGDLLKKAITLYDEASQLRYESGRQVPGLSTLGMGIDDGKISAEQIAAVEAGINQVRKSLAA